MIKIFKTIEEMTAAEKKADTNPAVFLVSPYGHQDIHRCVKNDAHYSISETRFGTNI